MEARTEPAVRMENDVEVRLVPTPPACVEPGSCASTRARCEALLRSLGVSDAQCVERDAVACFDVTVVMSGVQDTVCGRDMSECWSTRRGFERVDYSDPTACYVVRYTR